MKLNSNNLYKVIQRKLFSEDECKKILNSEITPAPFKTKGHDSFVDFIVPNEDNKWIRDRIEKEIEKIADAEDKIEAIKNNFKP